MTRRLLFDGAQVEIGQLPLEAPIPSGAVVSVTLGAATAVVVGDTIPPTNGSVSVTLEAASINSGDGSIISPIVQQIWIVETPVSKKKKRRIKREIQDVVREIDASIKQVEELAKRQELEQRQLAKEAASIERKISLLESKYAVLQAEAQVLEAIKVARAQKKERVRQRLAAIEEMIARQKAEEERLAAERARREAEEMADLTLILEFMLADESGLDMEVQ